MDYLGNLLVLIHKHLIKDAVHQKQSKHAK